MHVRVVFLQPFFTFLGRAPKLAILGAAATCQSQTLEIRPLTRVGRSWCEIHRWKRKAHTSGGRVHTARNQHSRHLVWEGFHRAGWGAQAAGACRTSTVDHMPGLGLGWNRDSFRVCRLCHVTDGRCTVDASSRRRRGRRLLCLDSSLRGGVEGRSGSPQFSFSGVRARTTCGRAESRPRFPLR